MQPFYYKHILFNDETSNMDYAVVVDKINEIDSYPIV